MSSAPCSSASARAAARNSALAGWIPPSPCTGSIRIAPVSGPTAAASESASFSRANRTAGASGSNGAPLARLARGGERAVRAAVERALERDDDRLPRRLARPLERGLDRLGAGVAEERARAAEAGGEQLGEPEHRLGRVEVRRVPEGVELAVRRGQRRRVAVAERDDRDPGEQVEVPLAVGVGQPDAVAGDEGDVVPRVRRQERRGREHRRHATTAVAPIDASTPPRAATTAAWSFGTIPPPSAPAAEQALGLGDADRRGDRSAEQQPGHVGDEEELVGAEPDRERGRRLVGVHVQRARRRAARRRGRARRRARPRSRRGDDGSGEPTCPSSGTAYGSRPISSPKSGTARGPIAAQTSALTAAKELAHDRERRRARHPAPVDEPRPRARAARARPRSAARRRGRRRPRARCASASASVAASPATAPPTLSDDPAHVL